MVRFREYVWDDDTRWVEICDYIIDYTLDMCFEWFKRSIGFDYYRLKFNNDKLDGYEFYGNMIVRDGNRRIKMVVDNADDLLYKGNNQLFGSLQERKYNGDSEDVLPSIKKGYEDDRLS